MERADILYERNKGLVPFVRNKINRKFNDSSMEDDLMMAGFEGLNKACMLYNGSTKFSTFAVPCIRNSMLSFINQVIRNRSDSFLSLNTTHREDSEDFIDDIEDTSYDVSERITDKEDIQEILASLIVCANERDQNIFIENVVLKESQDCVSKKYKVSQSYVSRLSESIVRRIRSIMQFMNNAHCVPNINKCNSNKEYRREYAEFYIKNCRKRKIKNSSLVESDLVSKVFDK